VAALAVLPVAPTSLLVGFTVGRTFLSVIVPGRTDFQICLRLRWGGFPIRHFGTTGLRTRRVEPALTVA